MTAYDDPERLLQDQGLEVVVVPYRPSPYTTNRHKMCTNNLNAHNNNNMMRTNNNSNNTSCDSTCTSISSNHAPEFMSSTNNNSPVRQLVTPRSQLAMVEAVCQQTSSSDKKLLHPIPSTPERDYTLKMRQRRSPNNGRTTHTNTNNANRSSGVTPSRQSANRTKSSSHSGSKHSKLSYLQLAKLGYQELVHAIIRPPRSDYEVTSLGPDEFTFCDVQFTRRDFSVRNGRGEKLQCSFWSRWNLNLPSDDGSGSDDVDNYCHGDERILQRLDTVELEDGYTGRVVLDDWDESKDRGRMYLHLNEETLRDSDLVANSSGYPTSVSLSDEKDKSSIRTASLSFSQCTIHDDSSSTTQQRERPSTKKHPVVIYLHGNSSSRLEVLPQLSHLLSLGLSVLSFDFAGSGHSEGKYVSLGYHEREDLDSIIKYLRSTNQVSSIALWGRSMGAATALMYASRDPTISGMVLDSAFTDLNTLIEEMVERGKRQGIAVPNLVLSVAMRMIKNSVKNTAGFSLRHISPISHAERCFVPAMFVAGEHDDFIHKSHSIRIHRNYAGDKNISIVDGDHNSPRPRFLMHSACLFLQSVMRLPVEGELVVPPGMNLMIPPWLLNEVKKLRARRMGDWNSRERSWLSVKEEKPRTHPRLESETLEYNEGKGLQRKGTPSTMDESLHSNQDEVSVVRGDEVGDTLAAAAPPDMNERQKDIQSSLFKMLGQSESR